MKDFSLGTERNKKIKYVIRAISLVLPLIFSCKLLSAQINNDVLKTFSVKNEKISDAIIKLSNQSNLNFSYDASDETLNKKITYTATGKTVTAILDEILKETGNTFKRIGNQIVIYKSTKNENAVGNKISKPAKKTVDSRKTENKQPPLVKTVLKTDTLLVIDTVILRDTVLRIDTVRVVDTVIIKKEKPKPRKPKSFPVDYFNMQESREKGWAATVYYAPLLTRFTFTQEEKPLSFRSFMLGANAVYLKSNWDITFGINLSHFANRFAFSHTVTQGGFYLADTIDAYYTVTGTDTSWYYVTDSVWQPLETYREGYDKTNRVGYLELGLSAAYKFYKTKNKILYLRMGVHSGFPVYKHGTAIVNSEPVDFDGLTFGSPIFSAFAGAGIKYKLNSSVDATGEAFYTKYFQSMTDGLPSKIYPDNIGFKIGLVFYFR